MNEARQGYQKSDLELPWQHGMKGRQGEARLPEDRLAFPTRSGEGIGKIIGAVFADVWRVAARLNGWRWDTW